MSVTTVREILFDIAPEFFTTDTTGLAKIDRFIERSNLEINSNLYEINKFDMAVAYLTAHRLTLSIQGNSSSGLLIEEANENGQTTRKFANDSKGNELELTKFGKIFFSLKRKRTLSSPLII